MSLGVLQTLVEVIEALETDQEGGQQKQERDNRCRHTFSEMSFEIMSLLTENG